MELFLSIRTKISDFLLSRFVKKQNRQIGVVNLKQAQSVGIVYDASQKKSVSMIKELVQHLQKSGKHISTLGIIEGKSSEDVLIGDKLYNFASEKDFSFFFVPKAEQVINFANTKFDILLVAYPRKFQPIKVVSVMSNATFKVGRAELNEDCDFTLDVKGDDMKYFIEQVVHYLMIINNN